METSSQKPTTLMDVARKSGVSAMTVSNALNNRRGVSEKTKKRVLEAARELKYSPNQVAQSLRNARTKTIGVVMSDSSQNVFSKLLRGIEHAASDIGYSVLLANTDQKRNAEKKAIELLVSKRIDGLLLAAPLAVEPNDIEWLISLNTPFVLLMRTTDYTGIDYVANDNFRGGYLAMKHLYEIGDRNFCFISLDSSSGIERMKGCEQFLKEKGLCIGDYHQEKIPPQIEDGYCTMKKLITSGYSEGAICCGCDMIAVGVFKAIFEAHLSVPKNYRVIGYDDFDMAAHLRVPLTTIHQPVFQIGTEGFRVLMNRVNNPNLSYQSLILQPELIKRASTSI